MTTEPLFIFLVNLAAHMEQALKALPSEQLASIKQDIMQDTVRHEFGSYATVGYLMGHSAMAQALLKRLPEATLMAEGLDAGDLSQVDVETLQSLAEAFGGTQKTNPQD